MQNYGDLARKGLTLMVLALMLTLGVAIPVLERTEIMAGPVAESAHNPATCPPAHDHTVCTQVTSSHLLAACNASTCEIARAVVRAAPGPESHLYAGRTTKATNLSRAPPTLA